MAALGGCVSSGSRSAPSAGSETLATAAPTIAADQLVGRWGLASYRTEEEFARTQAEARAACNNPYDITKGEGGGVVMHLADQSQPTELALSVGHDRMLVILEPEEVAVWLAEDADPEHLRALMTPCAEDLLVVADAGSNKRGKAKPPEGQDSLF